jgi:hypothetical protein
MTQGLRGVSTVRCVIAKGREIISMIARDE